MDKPRVSYVADMVLAPIASLVFPGLGQALFNRQYGKAIVMPIACFLLWFVLLGWVVQIWAILDALYFAYKRWRASTIDVSKVFE